MTYLTIAEVAFLLRVDHKVVRRAIKAGQLPAVRIGRVIRVNAAVIDDQLAVQPERPESAVPRLPRPARPSGEFARRARVESPPAA